MKGKGFCEGKYSCSVNSLNWYNTEVGLGLYRHLI